MSMKTCLKKQVSVLVCFFLLLGIVTPFPVYGEDDVPMATLSPAYLIKSDQPQTVTMYVRLPATTKCKVFSCAVVTDGGITVLSATEELISGGTEIMGYIWWHLRRRESLHFISFRRNIELKKWEQSCCYH